MERLTSKPFTQNFSSSVPSKTKILKQNNSTWTSKQKTLVAGGIISTIGLGALAYQQLKSPVTHIDGSVGSWFLTGIIGAASLGIFFKKLTAKSDEIKEVSSYIKALQSNNQKSSQEKEVNPQKIEFEKINKWIDSSKNVDKNNDEYTNLKCFFEGEWPENKLFGESLSKFHSLTLEMDHEYAVNLAATCKDYMKSNSNLLTPYLHNIIETTLKHENPDIQQKIRLWPSLLPNSHDSTTTNDSNANATEKLRIMMDGKMYQISQSQENEGKAVIEFIDELKKYKPETADYNKIDKSIDELIHFYEKGFFAAKMFSNTFKIDYSRNLYNQLTRFFTIISGSVELFGESLKKFHSLALLIDFKTAINLAAWCVNDLRYNSRENQISHEIIKATIQNPLFTEHRNDYPELEPYTEIASNDEINSFIDSIKTTQKNEVDYQTINEWIDYLSKINTHQKEEKVKLSNPEINLHNNLANSLYHFFESKLNDYEFFEDSFEKFFSLTLEFYPRFAINLVVNPHLKTYFKNFNPEDIKEEFKTQFAIACAEKADDSKILKSYADKIWYNLRGVTFLLGCAKVNNVFCQHKIQESTYLFRETTFNQDALDLFDVCIENLYDEETNTFRKGNKAIINTAYTNFSDKNKNVQLKLSNSFDKVQNAYSKAGFILPLDIKDEAANQCAMELFDPLFNCLVRSHGKTTDSSKNIEKLLNISKKFEELQPFYNQAIETLRLDKTNDWSLVLSNLAKDQDEILKNAPNTLSLPSKG